MRMSQIQYPINQLRAMAIGDKYRLNPGFWGVTGYSNQGDALYTGEARVNLFVAIPNEIVLTFEIQFSIPAKIND